MLTKKTFCLFVLAFLLAMSLTNCSGTGAPTAPSPAAATTVPVSSGTSLTVSAGSSLTDAFKELGKVFENAHAGTKVNFNFGGSQDLRTQIEQGAQVDVFASADTKNMDALQTKGLLAANSQTFVHNRLVVIVPKANPAGVKELKDLAKPGLKLDVADESVPVGSYTVQMLDKLSADASYGADFKNNVLARVVSKENNVKQVVSKVSLGEADAGVVYTTDAQSAADKLTTIEVPDKYNIIATYPIAVIKPSANAALAQQFVDLVLSEQGQALLKKYGFAPR